MTLTQDRFNEILAQISSIAQAGAKQADLLHKVSYSVRDGDALRKLAADMAAQKFKIVLVAPFQGGKSTIFDALVGGREISPVGFGLKTSACAIEAHHLPAGEEYSALEWRDDRELIDSFVQSLRPYLPAGLGDVDLRDPNHLVELHKAFGRAGKQIRRDSSRGEPSLHPDDVERLRAGWLILHHRDTFESARPGRVALSEAGRLLRFPTDWHSRNVDEFAPDDVAFLFLKRVRFFVASPALRDLRAVLVDCPGRQAGGIDAAVAEESITNAHAVIFLLGTEGKGIGRDGLESARWLAERGTTERLFVAYNAKNVSEDLVRHQFLPADVAQLNTVFDPGLRLPDVNVFNALLALRTGQYLGFDDMPDETIRALADRFRTVRKKQAERTQVGDRELARRMVTEDIIDAVRSYTGDRLDALTPEDVQRVRDESGWPALLGKVTDFVARRTAVAMLVENGSDPVGEEIKRINADVERAIHAPFVTALDWLDSKQAAKAALERAVDELGALKAGLLTWFRSDGAGALNAEVGGRIAGLDLRSGLAGTIRDQASPRHLDHVLHGAVASSLSAALNGWVDRVEMNDSAAGRGLRDQVDEAATAAAATLGRAQADGGVLLDGLSGTIRLSWGDLPGRSGRYHFAKPHLDKLFVTDVADEFDDGSLVGTAFKFLRIGFGVVREAVTGDSFNYDLYVGQLPGVVAAAKSQAVAHGGLLVAVVTECLCDRIEAAFDTTTAEIEQVFRERVAEGDARQELGVDILRGMAEQAAAIQADLKPIAGPLAELTREVRESIER